MVAAVWSSSADGTSSHPQLQGEGEHQESEGVPEGTMARLPRAVGMAPASFPVHFPPWHFGEVSALYLKSNPK